MFLVVVRSGGASLRPEWADEARALATMVARLTHRAVTPLIAPDLRTFYRPPRPGDKCLSEIGLP